MTAAPSQKWQVEFCYIPTGARAVLEVDAGDFIEAHRRALEALRKGTRNPNEEAENLLIRIERIL